MPCQCRWRPPAGQSGRNLLKGESRGERGRGPARPGQVPARSLSCAAQVSLDRLRGWPQCLGGTRCRTQKPAPQDPGRPGSCEPRVTGFPAWVLEVLSCVLQNLRSPRVLESQSRGCAELGRRRAVARSGPGVLSWVFVRSRSPRRGAAPGRPASPTLRARVLQGTQRAVGGGPREPCSGPYVTDSEFPDPGPTSCGPGSASSGGP